MPTELTAESVATNMVRELQRELKGTFPKAGIQKIWPMLIKEPIKAMDAAYDYFILNSPFLPSPAQLLVRVQQEGKLLAMAAAKKREDEWNEKKGADKHGRVGGSTFLTQEQHNEYGKRCKQIYELACPTLNSYPIRPDAARLKMLVELCEVMEAAYPRSSEEWKDLKSHFVKMGMNGKSVEPTIIDEHEPYFEEDCDPTYLH